MPLSSVSFQVFPTENVPFVLSFDLCMKPELSDAPGRGEQGRCRLGRRTGDEDVAWLLSLSLAGVLPDLDMGDVGLEHVLGGVTLVEDGGDDALPSAVVVRHGDLNGWICA